MTQLTRRLRAQLLQANNAVGRRIGLRIAPAPLPNSLAAELRTLLSGLSISHVLDVGAHRGAFARRLRSDIGYRGDITSFEPSPSHYRVLLEAASSDQKWSALNVALGAVEGIAELHQYEGDGQFDSLRRLGPHAGVYMQNLDASPEETISVPVQRLDSLWRQVGRVPTQTFLKVDTQGFDLEVLEGAGDLLAEFPAVLLEVAVMPLYVGAPVVADVFAALAAKGFELTGAFPIHRYASDLRVIEFDCTFVNQRLFDDGHFERP